MDSIIAKLEHWRKVWPLLSQQDLFSVLTFSFDKRDLLEATDVYINTISPHDKASFENGGAVYVTVVWLCMGCPKANTFAANQGDLKIDMSNDMVRVSGLGMSIGLSRRLGQLVDKIMQHYGLTYDAVTPLCAIRKVLAAEIHRRNAWQQLVQLFPWADYNATSIVDGVTALASKLDHSHQVYDIEPKVLEDLVQSVERITK